MIQFTGREYLLAVTILIAASLLGSPLGAATAHPPILEKIVFMDYAAPSHLGSSKDCGNESGKYSTISGGLRWKSFPVTYYVNGSASGIDIASAEGAVMQAFNEWDDEEHPSGVFFTAGSFDTAKIKVYWASIDGPGNVLAQTSFSYIPAFKEIVSAEIVFDTSESWFIAGNESCSSTGTSFDIQDIATHEIGHAVGLGHVNDPALTMYRYASPGQTLKRTLGVGDQKGLDKLY